MNEVIDIQKGHQVLRLGTKHVTACGCALADAPLVEDCPYCQEMLTCTEGWQQDGHLLREGFYGNNGIYAVVVVASVLPGVDWTAYIGGYDGMSASEEEAVRWVARHGVKLPYHYAKAFFGDLPDDLYRR